MWRPAISLTGIALLVTACGVAGGPSTGPSANAPSASATPRLIEPGAVVDDFRALGAGTYVVDDPLPVRVSFIVSVGWRRWAYTPAGSQMNLVKPDTGEISFEIVDNVSANPCTDELLDPPVGPSVDDLVTGLSDLNEFEVSPPTGITIDGFTGKQLTITAPAKTECESLHTWRTTTRQNSVGAGEVNEVRILDVDGVRLVISVAHAPSLPVAARREIDSVLESIQIGP
jgi:hypothetical protein